jgi:hypothetical protein
LAALLFVDAVERAFERLAELPEIGPARQFRVQLMKMPIGEEMNMLCQRYDGVSRVANLLERLAEGSADGRILVPE